MGKVNNRVDAIRKAYRDALEAARDRPSAEAWAKLLAAGKELSLLQEPRAGRPGRRGRRASSAPPTIHDLEPETESRPEPELRPNSEVEMGTLD
ncbi:hypothetical protein [Anaeromyxobacter diazotrophicus]|uniref:Uncharacterized protein n=1 Tax=Anaeromyxobacter diazotrophicus TaxID=2590199 RepID=A0A7I9VM37_9BACT|nr:hypothetical protein [Anaeromyxobacter diazotrophicus]GEJ57461.1 hypothetical protein AMYX_22020 [Anaeromyxobacter diazotrophicus]